MSYARGDLMKRWEEHKGPKVPYVVYRKRIWKGRDNERALTENIELKRGGSRKGKFIGKVQAVWEEIKGDVAPTVTKELFQYRIKKGRSYKRSIGQPKYGTPEYFIYKNGGDE